MQLIFSWLMKVLGHQLFFAEGRVTELPFIAPLLCFTRPVMSLRAECNRTRLHTLLCRDRAKVAERICIQSCLLAKVRAPWHWGSYIEGRCLGFLPEACLVAVSSGKNNWFLPVLNE